MTTLEAITAAESAQMAFKVAGMFTIMDHNLQARATDQGGGDSTSYTISLPLWKQGSIPNHVLPLLEEAIRKVVYVNQHIILQAILRQLAKERDEAQLHARATIAATCGLNLLDSDQAKALADGLAAIKADSCST